MAKQGEIYKIVNKENPTTILYIGSTTTDLNTRWQKHISHSRKHNDTPFYKEIYKNANLYEIHHLAYVYYDDKKELLARESKKIKKYKPLANIRTNYDEMYDTADTDSDSDTQSYLYCRDDSDGSIWDTDDEQLTTEEKDNKYYKWSCNCDGYCCNCKTTNKYYEQWYKDYPEMYNHKYTNKKYIYKDRELQEIQ